MIAHCGPKKDRIIASSRAVSAQSFKISCLSGNDGLVYEDLSIDFGRTNFLQKSRYGVQTRWLALLEPAINKKRESNKSEHRAYRH